MTLIRTTLLILLCLGLTTQTIELNAQSATAEEPLIKAKFTVYSLKRLKELNFLHGDLQNASPIEFFSSARSPVYEYEGLNPIVFFREIPAPTAEDPNAIQRKKVAEVSLPQQGGEFLFIFFPSQNRSKENYKIYPLNDSKSALPIGSIRLFNATPYELQGVLGGDKIKLAQGPSKAYQVRGNSMSLGLGFKHGDQFHMSYNGPVELEKDSRGLFMVFPPFVKGSAILQTRFLREAEAKPKQTVSAAETTTPNGTL